MISRKSHWPGVLLAIACVLPALVWIAIDHQPFGGDQSSYAADSVRLYYALAQPFEEWPAYMLSANPSRGPGIAWIGQFFVGLGMLIGSVDRALLLLIVLTQVLSLVLIFFAVEAWSKGRREIAGLAVLITASAPLFAGFSHLFYIEPFQMMIVAWFLLILSRVGRWNKAFLIGQLFLASLVTIMMKASSPVYVIIIGFAILVQAFWGNRRNDSWNWREKGTAITWGIFMLLLAALGAWYWRNLDVVIQHTIASTSSPRAVYWGKEDTFLSTFVYWLMEVRRTFFPWLTMVLSSILIVAAVYVWLRKRNGNHDSYQDFRKACIVVGIQILFVLVVFSFGVIRLNRFLLPITPYFAILISWAVLQTRARGWIVMAALAFGLQLIMSHAYLFNLVPAQTALFDFSKIGHLHRLNTDTTNMKIMDEIIAIACDDVEQGDALTVVAIDPARLGDWLAPVPATYAALKAYGLHPPCRFGYAGDSFWGASLGDTWDRLVEESAKTVIIMDPAIYAPPERAVNQALTIENHPRLLEMLRTRGVFMEMPPLKSDDGILVFRRINQVKDGRALLDAGDIEAGIAALEAATKSEPQNPEAWANLTLGYVLAGRQDEALDAGAQALKLNPEHFYVHMMLAGIYQERGDHAAALKHISAALPSAPSAQQKVRALRARAKSLSALGADRAACLVLASAARVEAIPEIMAEMSELDCKTLIGGD